MAHCGQHILEMQLFYELKQRFPNIPDRVVSHCIKQTRGSRKECTCLLEAENWVGRISCGRPTRPTVDMVERLSELVLQVVKPSHSFPYNKPTEKLSINELLEMQLAQKNRLEAELMKEKARLVQLRESVRMMQADLRNKHHSIGVEIIKEEMRILRKECRRLTNEVDLLGSDVCEGSIPLGETNEEFYKNIYPGPMYDRKVKLNISRQRVNIRREEEHWCCHKCTFRNHPLLNICEECDMPRFAPQESCVGPDIRIHVTRHNYPSKVVHSWVL